MATATMQEPIPPAFDEDLIIDQEDEERLRNLSEIDRETILSERFEQLQRYKERKELYTRLVQQKELSIHSGFITKKKTPARTSRHVPAEVSAPEGDQSLSSSNSDSSSSDSSAQSSSSSSSSDSEQSDDEGENSLPDGAVVSSHQSLRDSLSSERPVEIDNNTIAKIQILREQLVNTFLNLPDDLRDEVLCGSFVRIPIGNGEYHLARIVSVHPSNQAGAEKAFDVLVTVPDDASEDRVVPVASISNHTCEWADVERWTAAASTELVEEVKATFHRKREELSMAKNFRWDDAIINRLLEQKRARAATQPVNATIELSRLRTELQAAMTELNKPSLTAEQRQSTNRSIETIRTKLHSLEKFSRDTRSSFERTNARLYGIVAINYRNKAEQRKLDVDAARKRLRDSATAEAPVDGAPRELNPFKRRECNPVVMWDVGRRSPKKPPREDPETKPLAPLEQPPTAAAIPAAQTHAMFDPAFLDSLASRVHSEKAAPASARLDEVRRVIRLAYDPSPLALWEEQGLVAPAKAAGGEVMPFEEWKRRAMEEGQQQQQH